MGNKGYAEFWGDVEMANRPHSYSRYWTGTSLQVRLIYGESFQMQMASISFNDMPAHEPPLQTNSSPIPKMRIWPM